MYIQIMTYAEIKPRSKIPFKKKQGDMFNVMPHPGFPERTTNEAVAVLGLGLDTNTGGNGNETAGQDKGENYLTYTF